MIYENEYGAVDFLPAEYFSNKKRILISLSGGADSTLAYYLTCKEITERGLDHELILLTHVLDGNSWAEPYSKNIVNIIRNLFPSVKINNHYFTYSTYELPDKDQNITIRRKIQELVEQDLMDVKLDGWSMGPPSEVQNTFSEQNGEPIPWGASEEAGQLLRTEPKFGRLNSPVIQWYLPFGCVHKRYVNQVYLDLDIGYLRTKTRSCTGGPGKTDNFNKYCMKCWWCYERKWSGMPMEPVIINQNKSK